MGNTIGIHSGGGGEGLGFNRPVDKITMLYQ